MIKSTIKELHIQHDEQLRMLRVNWAAGHDLRRFQPVLEQLSQLADRLRITHLLIGMENMPEISAYDQIWLGSQWLPKLLRLPLRQVVVVLASGQVYNQHAIETVLMGCVGYTKIDVQFFTQEVTGMHWLLDGVPRLPALLAEWEAAFNPPATLAPGMAGPTVRYHYF